MNTYHLVHARSRDSRLFIVVASTVEDVSVANLGNSEVRSTRDWRSRGGSGSGGRGRGRSRGGSRCRRDRRSGNGDDGRSWDRSSIGYGRLRDLWDGRGSWVFGVVVWRRDGDRNDLRGGWSWSGRRGRSRGRGRGRGRSRGRSRRSRSRSSTVPDSGSGSDKLEVLSGTTVNTESLEHVVHVVDRGELVGLGGESGTGTDDVGLETDGVDLRSTGRVHTDQAVSNEVVSSSEIGRDLEVPFQGRNDLVGGPLSAVKVGFRDLEPVKRGGVNTVTAGYPSIWLLVPVKRGTETTHQRDKQP